MTIAKRKISEPFQINEAAIKVALIDHVIDDLAPNAFITRELPYSFDRRRADLAIIGDAFIGFEIKSDVDKLDKLDDQLGAYCRSFHFTFVATTQKHLSKVRQSAPKGVGIYLFTSDGIRKVRNAIRRKRLDKDRLLSMIDRATIERAITSEQRNRSQLKKAAIEELYGFAAQSLTQEQIESLVRTALQSKYSQGFSLFMAERGKATVTDDLLLLGIEREIS